MFDLQFRKTSNSIPGDTKTSEEELRKTIHDFATKLVEGDNVLSTTITFSENGIRPVSSSLGIDWLDDLKAKKMPKNSNVGMFGIGGVNSLCKVSINSFDPDTKIQNIINIHIGQPKVISQVFSTDDLPGYIYQNNRYYKGYFVSGELKELLRNREYDDSTRVIVERSSHTSTSSISVIEPDVNTPELSRTSIVFKDLDEFFENIGIIKDEIDKVLNKDNNKGLKKQFGKN